VVEWLTQFPNYLPNIAIKANPGQQVNQNQSVVGNIHNQFTALWILSGTTRESRYQKKHSPTHTYCGHQSSLICFLHLLWSMASSLFNIYTCASCTSYWIPSLYFSSVASVVACCSCWEYSTQLYHMLHTVCSADGNKQQSSVARQGSSATIIHTILQILMKCVNTISQQCNSKTQFLTFNI